MLLYKLHTSWLRYVKTWDEAESALNDARLYAPEDTAIDNEKAELDKAREQAAGVAAPQTLSSNPNAFHQANANINISLAPVNLYSNTKTSLDSTDFLNGFLCKLSEHNDRAEKWRVKTTQSGVNTVITPLKDGFPLNNLDLMIDYSEHKTTGNLNKKALVNNLEQMAATLLGSYMLANGGVCPRKITDIVIELTPPDPVLRFKLAKLISTHIECYNQPEKVNEATCSLSHGSPLTV